MTIRQSFTHRLRSQGFNDAEIAAIIAICLAVEYAEKWRLYWAFQKANVTSQDYEQMCLQVDAIARAYRSTFTNKPEPA